MYAQKCVTFHVKQTQGFSLKIIQKAQEKLLASYLLVQMNNNIDNANTNNNNNNNNSNNNN